MPGRILIVDDERQVLDGFRTVLELDGYNVWTAGTPTEALAIAQEAPVDLVVLDFIIPTMDGLELLARIRRHQPLVRSIVISGKFDGQHSENDLTKMLGEQVEADLYLHKPISNERLLTAIRSLLNETHAGDWKTIAGQIVQRQAAHISKAKATSKSLRRSLRKK